METLRPIREGARWHDGTPFTPARHIADNLPFYALFYNVERTMITMDLQSLVWIHHLRVNPQYGRSHPVGG